VKCRLFIFLLITAAARGQINFTSVDSVFAYAERNSSVNKINNEQILLAKWTKVAALANTINFRNPVTFTATDNLMLPVSFIPADAFGGPHGTFKSVTLGQQYVSNFNFNPQIDIINPYNLAKVKSASINKELTQVSALLNKRNLFESISAAYFNIISTQEQIITMQQNLVATDSLVMIASNKYSAGLIREQDVNNVKVIKLSVQDKLTQLQKGLDQQVNSLKILCDIAGNTKVSVSAPNGYKDATYSSGLTTSSSLLFKNSVLQSQFARSELRANRWSTLPVISAVYYQGWQNNSNSGFFDSKQPWIQSQYIGLRISVPFPPDVNKLSQNYTSKINYRIANMTAEHARLQNDLTNENLNLDYEKALSSYSIAKEIYTLKNNNYGKSLNQYKEGIMSTDIFLTAYTDMLTSKINVSAAQAALEHAKTRIQLNNNIK
jgi:OMF family outer membrane factor